MAAIDSRRGLADEASMPWGGRVPTDAAYYRDHTAGGIVVMGYGTYKADKPLSGKKNLVATHKTEVLDPGFEILHEVKDYLAGAKVDIWVVGGQGLFETTLDQADELYLTQLEGDFGCTKFFPEYTGKFEKISESEPITENGITYTFQVWKRLPKQG